MDDQELGRLLRDLCLKHNCSDLKELQAFYLSHFFEFCREVLGYDKLETIPHLEICNFIAYSRGDGQNRTSNIRNFPLAPGRHRFGDKRRLALLVPRDSFKTTIVGVCYPIWVWCRNPEHRFLIVSATAPKAQDILKEIKDHLTKNQVLITLFGEMGKAISDPDATWSRDNIQIYDVAERGYVPFRNMNSARALGMEGNYTGSHPDTAICDDLVIPQNVSSPDQLSKTVEFIKNLEPTLGSGTELIISGTRYHYQDAYGALLERETFDVFYRSAYNEDGTLWFAERLTEEYLRAKEIELGSYIFSCQYLMMPINPKDANFKAEWVDSSLVKSCPKKEDLRILVVLDPAAGASTGQQRKTLDYTAIVILGMDSLGNIWVLDARERKLSATELADELIAIYQLWNPESLCIEAVGFQTYLEPIIEQRAEDLGAKLNIERIRQTTRESKNHRIVARIQPRLQGGKIKILEHLYSLISELRRFDASKLNNKDNLLDALEMGVRKLNPPAPSAKELTQEDIDRMVAQRRYESNFWPTDWSKLDGKKSSHFNNIFYG